MTDEFHVGVLSEWCDLHTKELKQALHHDIASYQQFMSSTPFRGTPTNQMVLLDRIEWAKMPTVYGSIRVVVNNKLASTIPSDELGATQSCYIRDTAPGIT